MNPMESKELVVIVETIKRGVGIKWLIRKFPAFPRILLEALFILKRPKKRIKRGEHDVEKLS